MSLLARLTKIWEASQAPFLIAGEESLSFAQIMDARPAALDQIKSGDVVAVIGDFDPVSIAMLLGAIDRGAVIVPLTSETREDHDYFFEAALVDKVFERGNLYERPHSEKHPFTENLREQKAPGLVLFSSGTTGRPKAILHDLNKFLVRYSTPRPTLRTLNFLLFDHIGGVNTLLHTLFNRGLVVAPKSRQAHDVIATIREHNVELLPTTPTFLRMLLLSGLVPDEIPASLKIITYGTERMDQPTLDALCERLPGVDFRQTFGMSELGIVRVKSVARNSLFMHVGGEGVETRVTEKGVLQIRSASRMLGYLNAPSPFDENGWYDTGDIVEVHADGAVKVTGRVGDVINVGGIKFLPSEVERAALVYPGVEHAVACGKPNPITGHHVELTVSPQDGSSVDKLALKAFLAEQLPPPMVPRRIQIGRVTVGHRFKKL